MAGGFFVNCATWGGGRIKQKKNQKQRTQTTKQKQTHKENKQVIARREGSGVMSEIDERA